MDDARMAPLRLALPSPGSGRPRPPRGARPTRGGKGTRRRAQCGGPVRRPSAVAQCGGPVRRPSTAAQASPRRSGEPGAGRAAGSGYNCRASGAMDDARMVRGWRGDGAMDGAGMTQGWRHSGSRYPPPGQGARAPHAVPIRLAAARPRRGASGPAASADGAAHLLDGRRRLACPGVPHPALPGLTHQLRAARGARHRLVVDGVRDRERLPATRADVVVHTHGDGGPALSRASAGRRCCPRCR